MSLWHESLGLDLDDCGEDAEKRAQCILAHLSMGVPRSWWERSLQTGRVPDSFVRILHDLHGELLKTSVMAEDVGFGLLVALAFADNDKDRQTPRFGTVYSGYSVEQYLAKARAILAEHPELGRLGQKIARRSKYLASRNAPSGD